MHTSDTEQQAPAKRVTVRDIVAILFRRKWIIIGVFFVTTGVTAGFIMSQPTYWESTGKVLVKRGMSDNLLQGYRRTLSWEEELASEVETAMSPAVIGRARAVLGERREAKGEEPLGIDPGRVEAAVVGESNVLAISYRDLVPEICTEVTDAMLVAYTAFRQETYMLEYPAEFFDTEISTTKAELDGLQDERRDFLNKAQIVDVSSERMSLLTQRSHAKASANNLNQELAQKEKQLQLMYDYEKNPEKYPDIPFVASQFTGNELVISEIKSEMVDKQMRHAELARIYQPGVQELVRLEEEIQHLRDLLKEEVKNRIRLAELELSTHGAMVSESDRTLGELDARLASMPHQENMLADFDHRITALKEKYEDLVRNAERAKVNQATSQKQTVFILAPASAPYPKNTRDYVRIALAPIFSLIVGLGLAFFMDSLDTTVRNPRDVEDSFELPVLATLNEQKRQ
jgi:uncharacterized protein involved in exopolysaccharide biosynthesis